MWPAAVPTMGQSLRLWPTVEPASGPLPEYFLGTLPDWGIKHRGRGRRQRAGREGELCDMEAGMSPGFDPCIPGRIAGIRYRDAQETGSYTIWHVDVAERSKYTLLNLFYFIIYY